MLNAIHRQVQRQISYRQHTPNFHRKRQIFSGAGTEDFQDREARAAVPCSQKGRP